MSYNNQEQRDYADSLEPGYRFSPTDVELIVNYLKRKIDTGIRHPNMRHYEVNIYDYGPDELTAKPEYRSCENKWYFLTPRERKHPKGNRPNRATKNGGTWKASQKAKPQYDNMKRVVGSKTCLSYHDEKSKKTPWLMQEYTMDNPNIPLGSQEQKEDGNKLTGWVLCKIYKKETNAANSGSKLKQPAFQDPLQAFATDQVQQSVGNSTLVYYHNQIRPTSTNGHQSCGASSSSLKGYAPAIVEPGDDDMVVPHEEDNYDNLVPLDDLMTSAQDETNASLNSVTMQQMDSLQTIRDEVFQQLDQNSDDDTQGFIDHLMTVHKDDEDALSYHPLESYPFDRLDE